MRAVLGMARRIGRGKSSDGWIGRFECPITRQLMVDPVVASDGHTYERKALQKWLASNDHSPVTNAKMSGSFFMPSLTIRQTVCEMVEGGGVDAKTSLAYFMARGRMRAAGEHGDIDLDGAASDFERCRHLANTDDEHELVRFHKQTVSCMQIGTRIDVKAWLHDINALVAGGCELRHWKSELPKNTRVRVIADVAELKRLCTRPAPGVADPVLWVPTMPTFAGKVCKVDAVCPTFKGYRLKTADDDRDRMFLFPYDSVVVLPL